MTPVQLRLILPLIQHKLLVQFLQRYIWFRLVYLISWLILHKQYDNKDFVAGFPAVKPYIFTPFAMFLPHAASPQHKQSAHAVKSVTKRSIFHTVIYKGVSRSRRIERSGMLHFINLFSSVFPYPAPVFVGLSPDPERWSLSQCNLLECGSEGGHISRLCLRSR